MHIANSMNKSPVITFEVRVLSSALQGYLQRKNGWLAIFGIETGPVWM